MRSSCAQDGSKCASQSFPKLPKASPKLPCAGGMFFSAQLPRSTLFFRLSSGVNTHLQSQMSGKNGVFMYTKRNVCPPHPNLAFYDEKTTSSEQSVQPLLVAPLQNIVRVANPLWNLRAQHPTLTFSHERTTSSEQSVQLSSFELQNLEL